MITRPLGPPQQKFIPIMSMISWTPSQVLSVQHRLFESPNVIVRRNYVKTSAMIPQLLQLDVLHNFG
jgi:hypothetical protein